MAAVAVAEAEVVVVLLFCCLPHSHSLSRPSNIIYEPTIQPTSHCLCHHLHLFHPHPSSALCVSFSCAGDVYIPVTAAVRPFPLYPPRHCFTSFVLLLFLSTLSAAAIHHHPWRSLLVMIIILNVVVGGGGGVLLLHLLLPQLVLIREQWQQSQNW